MKRLQRSASNRMLAGICGGLGEYFNIDPTMIRLLMIVGLFISMGTFVLIYVLAIFVIPPEQ
ncbi:phage shock protein C [Caldalkalibacillus uzonensis]|uniref:Phage shock protein C n=1 Tax=Caldalkalibacillus uzonensis TaxID=353224 RepID=A0ABU0CX89_9BACI|nr:PspC domain-containing protein [Caldalkalibacillus uzonensis]MDQ0340863.1 phage shock protein C [Caldalkalibacillus uzonensis]